MRLHAHGKEGPEEENAGAPQLWRAEPFMKDPGGKSERTGGTKKLQRLRECDPDFTDRDVIENMGGGDAGDRRDDENEVDLTRYMKGRSNFPEQKR